MKFMKSVVLSLLVAVFAVSASACGGAGGSGSGLTGAIKADGSSTVGPITQAVAEEFKNANPDVNTTVGISGTTGGMKKFVAGEIDIANASRKIKQEETDAAKAKNIEAIEFEVAYDGIAIVVNKENTFATDLTPEELKKMWEVGSTVKTWKDVRPEWPAEPIKFYSPGTDSGTFEYFTEAINHSKKKEIRQDITASEDDNVLVKGVAGDKYAIGYFGVAYYEENMDKINIVKVNGVAPTQETVMNGTYKPLSRPLFIYVNKKSFERAEVKEFLKFYMINVKNLVKEVGYFPLEDSKYDANLNNINGK